MRAFLCLVLLSCCLWMNNSAYVVVPKSEGDESTLRLLHVVFRHGDRNPDQSSLIPDSSYYNVSYYPEGYGQLTNAGKLTEYKLGQLLRKRYDDFLTDSWKIDYLDARTTNVDRTKMSLELVLAGLYPPKEGQVWSDLPWQPIPYYYESILLDKETQPWAACAIKFYLLLNQILHSDEIVQYGKRYEKLLEILTEKTGSSAITLSSPFSYYFGFLTQQEVGYPLQDWVSEIYPEPIRSAAVDYYYYITNTTTIRHIAGGFLIRKILQDTVSKINGTISPSERKVFFYSAHELNVATTLLTLDAFQVNDIPPYGSHVIFEIHEIDGIWGIKLFYQNYQTDDDEPIALKLPGCDYFCSYDDFYGLVEEILPESDADCYI